MVQRVRSRGAGFKALPSTTFTQKNTACGAIPTYYGPLSQPVVGETETMTDTVTPRYHSRSNKGEVFFNPMSQTRQTIKSHGGRGSGYRNSVAVSGSCPTTFEEHYCDGDDFPRLAGKTNVVFTGTYVPDNLFSGSELSDAVKEASTQCLANIDSTTFNFSETIAELDQSLGMVSQSKQNVLKILDKIPQKQLRGAADAYLLYRYGMRPLVSDISKVLGGMQQALVRRRYTVRGFSNLSKQTYGSKSWNRTQITSNIGWRSSDTVTVRAMSLCESSISRLDHIGLSAKGLLSLPWELVPYSFVVDYFVNVGDVLRSFLPAPGVQTLGSCLVLERSQLYYSYPISETGNSTWVSVSPMTGGITSELYTKTRGSLSSPGLVIRGDFRLQNLQRAMDLSALILQKLVF